MKIKKKHSRKKFFYLGYQIENYLYIFAVFMCRKNNKFQTICKFLSVVFFFNFLVFQKHLLLLEEHTGSATETSSSLVNGFNTKKKYFVVIFHIA